MAAKKKKVVKVDDKDMQQAPQNEPQEADGVIFVNREKLSRAKDIVALLTGKLIPRTPEESDRKELFSGFLAQAEIDLKDPKALQFVYEKLGGLVRTPDEQEVADEEAEVMRKKNKKRAIEEDK